MPPTFAFDQPGVRIRLDELPTDPPKGTSRKEAEARLAELGEELFELQDLLWGARLHSLLVVLQGRDTAGKDGVIKTVAGYLNPRGVHVVSFGPPTQEELEHDFLWRVHRHTPRKGEVAIWNRSHYEDVLVVRVHGLTPASIWRERYGHICDFEELLAEHDTIVRKFFLHISHREQQARLLERERDPRKAWKLSVGDWREREHWDAYTEAYEEAISRCATPRAPWIVVPADAKWYRNLVVAEALVEALRPYRPVWEAHLDALGHKARAELAAYRAAARTS
ncbi:MAG: polyphosphate kinase 2 family protein [Myxococcales bacterium]|nr:polyphosphate kinase 2 family protein [Myxococcota bacterium]MDW8282113.1 polyphosphate kinase 2 family protein [Myxococcales bacterium]